MPGFLRYPGGKQRLIPVLLPLILERLKDNDHYVEPFVGGGSVALAVAAARPRVQITLNDADPGVYAVWHCIATGHAEAVGVRLAAMTPTVRLFRELTDSPPENDVAMAVRFIALNRMAFSGKGHTSPIGGWNQDGPWKINAEWRIAHIAEEILRAQSLLAGRTAVTCLDYSRALFRDAVMYIDPPYYRRGPSMYPLSMTHEQHVALASELKRCRRWILSYDDCPEVRDLYASYEMITIEKTYSAQRQVRGKKITGKELVIVSASCS